MGLGPFEHEIRDFVQLYRDLERRYRDLERECARLARDNNEQCDEIHELREQLKKEGM